MTSVDSNFNFLCGRPHGAGPPPPIHMRPPEPDPLRVDIINGWPLTKNMVTANCWRKFALVMGLLLLVLIAPIGCKSAVVWWRSSFSGLLKAVNWNTERMSLSAEILWRSFDFVRVFLFLGKSEIGDITQAVWNCERRNKYKSCDGIWRQGLLLLLQNK